MKWSKRKVEDAIDAVATNGSVYVLIEFEMNGFCPRRASYSATSLKEFAATHGIHDYEIEVVGVI